MARLTVRTDDDLVRRLRVAAAAQGSSVNSYVVSVLDAATDPNLAGDAAQRIRKRLAAAGLLAAPSEPRAVRPTVDRVRAAAPDCGAVAVYDTALRRAAAAKGSPLIPAESSG